MSRVDDPVAAFVVYMSCSGLAPSHVPFIRNSFKFPTTRSSFPTFSPTVLREVVVPKFSDRSSLLDMKMVFK